MGDCLVVAGKINGDGCVTVIALLNTPALSGSSKPTAAVLACAYLPLREAQRGLSSTTYILCVSSPLHRAG